MSIDIPAYPHSRLPGFAASSLDRQAHRRAQAAELARQHDEALVLLVHDYRMPTINGEVQLIPYSAVLAEASGAIWLGHWRERSLYALDVSGQDPARWPDLKFADLRGAAMRLDPDHASVMAYARAMVHWHKQHQFCGKCGGSTAIEQAGHVRRCTSCATEHYPRTDPSMLVLVADEQDRALLGRQAAWPAGFWSVLAGFVEPGESIEDAVVRETWEEARIQVTAMRYVTSQPWPFPASVLMGFQARGVYAEPQVEQDELEAAGWFSRSDIVDGVLNGQLILPPGFTLSWHLIEDWFDQDSPIPLKEIIAQRAPGRR